MSRSAARWVHHLSDTDLRLRHTGNTYAAATGASLADLMARMGHSSPRAAMLYQHATREQDTRIALHLDALVSQVRGTQGAREAE